MADGGGVLKQNKLFKDYDIVFQNRQLNKGWRNYLQQRQ